MAPRVPAGGRKSRTDTPPPSTPPREAAIGDNSAGLEEAERVQLISFISRLTTAGAAVEKAKAPFEEAKKNLTQIFRLGKAAGFGREQLERYLKKMGESTRDVAAERATEAKHFRWLGILDDDQAELQLGDAAPQEVKDEAHWKAEGYKAGLRQMAASPPKEMPERFVQPWLGEHARGLEEVLNANCPKPLKSVREQAAADFAEEHPEYEPGTPEAKAADRKATERAKAALDGLGKTPPEHDVAVLPDGKTEGDFEATADELAGQTTRQAVQGARAAEDVV